MAHCKDRGRGCVQAFGGTFDLCNCRCESCVSELDLGESPECEATQDNRGRFRSCFKFNGHNGPHLDSDGEWSANPCDAATQNGRCTLQISHAGRHRDASGHFWGADMLSDGRVAGLATRPAALQPERPEQGSPEPEFRPCGTRDPRGESCFLESSHNGPHEGSQGEWAKNGEDQCLEYKNGYSDSTRRSSRCVLIVGHTEQHCTLHADQWDVADNEQPQCEGQHGHFGQCMHLFDHTGPHISVSGHQWHGDSSLADIEPSASVMWNQGGASVTARPRRSRSSDASLPQELDWGDRLNREVEWVTGDGRRVLIVEMETGHLMNTIRYLERSGTRNASYKAMVKEAARRVSGVGAALGVAEFPEPARRQEAATQQRASLSPEERERREAEHRAAAAAERERQLADRAVRDVEREQARLARARLEAEALVRRQELERQESARVVQELHRRWLRRWENFMTAVVMAWDVRGLVALARIFAYEKGPGRWREEFLLRAPDAMARGSLLEIDVEPLKGE